MAKVFKTISFDLKLFESELAELKDLLDNNSVLDEQKDILPFFGAREQLSSQIALMFPEINTKDKIAFEYDVFGDFRCDLAVGDSVSGNYCFIEFEDAKKNSIFKKPKNKYKSEFATRFEHGYSQIVDWFYKFNTQSKDEIEDRFDKPKIGYNGLLIIGRDQFLTTSEKKRLDWKMHYSKIDSKPIYCMTFDELYEFLNAKLEFFRSIT